MTHREGEDIGPYQVIQFLGRGSFGVVLLASDSRDRQQRYALKLVPCDHLDAGAAARARDAALAEAELMRRLRHPHIVTCHDVCWDAERRLVWLALDYMDGGDLQSLLGARRHSGEPPPEAPFVRRLIFSVGSALRYIHSQGVLHRDVKSSNVLLSRDSTGAGAGEIKLADFGISKLLEVTKQAHTVVGTPAYMSPELVRGEPYGTAADCWAFGVLLYELASLDRPFEAGNQLALVRKIVEKEPAALPAGTATDVVRTIMGLLEKDPQQRLQLSETLGLSTGVRGTASLPPPPSFPPPPAPRRTEPLRGRYVPAERVLSESLSLIDVVEAHAGEVGGAGAAAPDAELLPLPEEAAAPQASCLGRRPGMAFLEPEREQGAKAKEKQRGPGRRWLPTFRGLRSKSVADGELTAISAFNIDVEATDEEIQAAVVHPVAHPAPQSSPVLKWTGPAPSSPRSEAAAVRVRAAARR